MTRLKRHLNSFADDLRGSISVEFVLTIPVIMVIFTITFGTFHAYLQSSRAAKSMYVIGDIVSRYHIVTEDTIVQLQGLLDALYLGNREGFDLRVTRIGYISSEDAAEDDTLDTSALYAADGGYYFVDWSRAVEGENTARLGFDGYEADGVESVTDRLTNDELNNYDIPMMGSGSHVVLVNVDVAYNSPLAGKTLFLGIGDFFNNLEWKYDSFVWPRDPRGILLDTGVETLPATS